MIKSIFLFCFYVLVSSTGLYRLKVPQTLMDFDFIVRFVLYGLGFLLWLYILKEHTLSTAFPVAESCLIVATQMIGYFFLQEPFRGTKITGTLFIIVGTVLMFVQGEAR